MPIAAPGFRLPDETRLGKVALQILKPHYLIGGNGPGDRLHQFPEEIVEVG